MASQSVLDLDHVLIGAVSTTSCVRRMNLLWDTLRDADRQGNLCLNGLEDSSSSKWRWDVDDSGICLGLFHSLRHGSAM